MASFALDRTTWDMFLDAAGNIAVVTAPYAVAQDVATAVRTWLGEPWYDQSQGVNYQTIFGNSRPLTYLKAQIQAVALAVTGVATAQVFLSSVSGRRAVGQIQVTDTAGVAMMVGF